MHVWSNQKTVSSGEVTFFNPAVGGDSGFLGFVARPYWFEAQLGQTITRHELREAEQARGTTCPVWTYTDLAPISPPPPSDTAATTTPPQRDVVNASPSSSPSASASPSTPLLVRPASYRLLWKDTGTCTPGAASPVMSVCGPSTHPRWSCYGTRPEFPSAVLDLAATATVR